MWNFEAISAQGNGILRQHPNHWLINPDIVVMADGATSIKSKRCWRKTRRPTWELRVARSEMASHVENLLIKLGLS
jgi:hypothetical protein